MSLYLDHNATTPLDPRVMEAMLPHLRGPGGNPSSLHRYGRAARDAVERAREQVAALVNANPSQIYFIGGGTEANNLAIKGCRGRGRRILVGATEHASVLEGCEWQRGQGWAVERLEVDGSGRVTVERLRDSLRADTGLVSVMWANNETGVIQEIEELAAVVRGHGALFHSDAVQAAGKVQVDFKSSGVQLMSLSAHKFGGPQGVGALVVDSSVELMPLLHGGGQERGKRAGTESVVGIVGFGVAAELALAELAVRGERVGVLRDRFERELVARIPCARLFGADVKRLPNTSFFGLPGIDGETLLIALDRAGIAVASGAACGSGRRDASHVLRAMGVPEELARSALRVSFGPGNGEADVETLLRAVQREAERLWAQAEAWA